MLLVRPLLGLIGLFITSTPRRLLRPKAVRRWLKSRSTEDSRLIVAFMALQAEYTQLCNDQKDYTSGRNGCPNFRHQHRQRLVAFAVDAADLLLWMAEHIQPDVQPEVQDQLTESENATVRKRRERWGDYAQELTMMKQKVDTFYFVVTK